MERRGPAAIFGVALVGVAMRIGLLMGGCADKNPEAAPEPMSDAELAAATGLSEEAFGLVRAVGGMRLEPLPAAEGGASSGLRFEASAREGGPPVRTLLNEQLASHNARVYYIGMSASATIFAVLPSREPFEALRVMRTSLTGRADTEELIAWLAEWQERAPLEVAGAGKDFLNVQFSGPEYPDWGALAGEIFERYPRAAKGWWASPEALADDMQECRCFDLSIDF